MLLCIGSILKDDEIVQLREDLMQLRWADGRTTAGWHARDVKRNQQADPRDARLQAIRTRIAERIGANEVFALAVRPARMGPLLLSRYGPGMSYGRHVDDALMGGARSDVSFTLFLSDPADYEGGELVIESTAGEQPWKLPAGSLVLYPSTTLHRVAEVTRGTRLVAVGWAQSLIRDPARRELLFELDTARRAIFAQQGKSDTFDLVSKACSNLLRMWAEP
jgi:PKHD-type hydroxylase